MGEIIALIKGLKGRNLSLLLCEAAATRSCGKWEEALGDTETADALRLGQSKTKQNFKTVTHTLLLHINDLI